MDEKDGKYITDRIPHRPPFLWLDRVVEMTGDSLVAEKHIAKDLDVFQGHYPQYPLMPGVLLCEAVFQAGALLVGEIIAAENENTDAGRDLKAMPVLTRITGAKFKREVRPGDTIEIRVAVQEKVGPVWFCKGTVRVHGKVAVQVGFACALKNA